MNRILTAAAAAAFATLAPFSASHAATKAVFTHDLDLSSAEGQAKLQSRIGRAVRDVCGKTSTGSRVVTIDQACAAKARASVEKQVASRRSTSRNGG